MNKACLEFKNQDEFKPIDYNRYGNKHRFVYDTMTFVGFLALVFVSVYVGLYFFAVAFLFLVIAFLDVNIEAIDNEFDIYNNIHKIKYGYYSFLKNG